MEILKDLSDKTGVNGGISVNKSGSRYLTYYVNTTDKSISDKPSKGFCVGVEIKVTEERAQHALKSAYAYREVYETARKNNTKFDSNIFKDWRKRFVYAPELDGKITPFGEKITVVKAYPLTLLITGSTSISESLGNCLADSLRGSKIKCTAPHKNKGAKAMTLGDKPLTFYIGDGCEVA